MRTNEELAIAIAEEFDDGFRTKREFAEAVLEMYQSFEDNDAMWIFNAINKELEDRDYKNCEDLTELFFEVRERL